MPEIPDGYDAYADDRYDAQQPTQQRDDYLVRLPRSEIRALQRKAAAFDELRAGQPVDAQAAANIAAGLTATGDVPLEPGEAGLTRQRRELAADAPPDRAPRPDPYKAAEQVYDQVIADGGQEIHALGAAFNLTVNAAANGDERLLLDPRTGQRPRRP